jgi:hypothetical protein
MYLITTTLTHFYFPDFCHGASLSAKTKSEQLLFFEAAKKTVEAA